MKFFNKDIKKKNYIIATYELGGKNLRNAAWNLAIGQSVGNPNVRNRWETDDLFEKHSCIIMEDEEELLHSTPFVPKEIRIAFPTINTNWQEDGISHLLCQLMGGQMDIDAITRCRLIHLEIPNNIKQLFHKPSYGIDGIRKFTNVYSKPLLGSIIKPKIGISPSQLLDMIRQLVDGGVNFIKEDEIMASPLCCHLEDRLRIIPQYLNSLNHKIIYAYCINADADNVIKKARRVWEFGGNAVHINVWSGLGTYNAVRKLPFDLFIHFQKSGDKVFTDKSHRFGIDWNVICQLAGLMGVDFIHNGMWGGYSNNDEVELKKSMKILHESNVMPVLSCGMHPGLVNAVTDKFGVDYMANVGGAIHGHPQGTLSGAIAMRQAIDKTYGQCYDEAIEKWGKK